MANGSLQVKPGDLVRAGQPLGHVGLSGLTEYPHLHFTIRHQGKIADPFAYGAAILARVVAASFFGILHFASN